MITNENDFLGILIKCKDENNECYIQKIMNLSKMSDMDCMPFLKSLESKNIITATALGVFRLNPIAFSVYRSRRDRFFVFFGKLSVGALKFIITYVLGIISGLIIAYITHKFGW